MGCTCVETCIVISLVMSLLEIEYFIYRFSNELGSKWQVVLV
jgi:hypothetical protein